MSSSGSGTNPTYVPAQFSEYIITFEGSAVTSILYGVYLVIAGANIYLLRQRKTYEILLFYTILQLALATLFTIMEMYVRPGQLLELFNIVDPESIYLPPDKLFLWPTMVETVASILNLWISDAFLLYRCYHIYRAQNKYALVLPALIYLATVGSSIAMIVVDTIPGESLSGAGIQLTGKLYFSLSTAMNICATSFIIHRLWQYRRAMCNAVGPHQGAFYLSYIAMTLESALLYTAVVITTLILFVLNNQFEYVFIPVMGMVQVIAPALIIHRIARGISFEVDEYGSMTVGSIRFAAPYNGPHAADGTYSVRRDVTNGSHATSVFSSGKDDIEGDQSGPESLSIHEIKCEI